MSTYITTATFTGDGSTTTYEVPFPFLRGADLVATVDDVVTTFVRPNASTIEFSAAPANGAEIIISRETEIEEPAVDFSDGSAIYANDLDGMSQQLIYALQEVQNRIDGIEGGAGGDLPTPAGNERFLISNNSGSWDQKTVAQTQSILGVGNAVPAAASGNKFLVTNLSTATYELQTVAQIQTLLGVGASQLPDINGRANNFLVTTSAGTAYNLVTPATARTNLGLGNAALLNAGTSVANLVQLIAAGGGGSALPAVSGENLTNIAQAQDYVLYEKTADFTTSSTSFVTATASMVEVIAADGSWDSVTANGITVSGSGTYHVVIEAVITYANDLSNPATIEFAGSGSASPATLECINTIPAVTAGHFRIELRVTTSGASEFSFKVKCGAFNVTTSMTVLASRMHITKID
jgi:hypothetical protein